MFAVGGPPGAGAKSLPVNVHKMAKAAKVVADGGSLASDLEGMGSMAADMGNVVLRGLETLIQASLGFHTSQDFGVDGKGNITLGGNGLDVQGLIDVIGSVGVGGFASAGPNAARRGGKSVLSVHEAEQAMLHAKKEHEQLEKKLAGLMKRNRKLVSGAGKEK
jgi:hypothetical protein